MNRYSNADKERVAEVSQWLMSIEDMHKFEKVALYVTKGFQYSGETILSDGTKNTEFRTVNCERMIDTLLSVLGIEHEKI